MFFFDNRGFFSLVSLIIQCGHAWIFAIFFCVLSPNRSVWLSRWRAAFFGLGVALLAVALRFTLAHRNLAETVVDDGDALARGFYAIYLGGKVAFVWFLVGGVLALRQRAWPRSRWWPWLLIGLGVCLGAALPTVESVLLAQAPWAAFAFAYAAWHLCKAPDEGPEMGRRVVRIVLAVWSGLWIVYGTAAVVVGPLRVDPTSSWNFILQINTVIDLQLQVVLAAGLIVLVMQDAQGKALAAAQERDRLRQQVQRDERLRFQSTLVSGLAHEINNPLTAILGFAEDLDSADPVERAKAAQIVQEQAERCRLIVQRMGALARRQSFACGPVVVSELVDRVARGFERQLAAGGVTLALELDPEPRVLRADAAAIEQVLTNLLSNALQASPRGASITLGTVHSAQRLLFLVDDEGPGVPPADRQRIFEPFWTSKAVLGTGLGLAVVEALVHAHGGRIEVDDAPWGGARFLVSLPWQAGAEARTPAPEAAPAPERAPAAELAVLVVDDEPLVRSTIRRQVGAHGWNVVEAESGEQGLRMLLRSPAPFDAVICDLRMPGMSGVDLHDEIARRAPHLLRRFVFVTGDPASVEATAFAQRSTVSILAKPFAAADLLGRLREVGRSA